MILPLLQRFWLPLVLVAALVGSHWYAYDTGRDSVQVQWDAQRLRDSLAADLAARARREQLAQVKLDAQAAQTKLRDDAATASDAAGRLRKQVSQLLAARASTAASGSSAGKDTCGMLADVLSKSVERSRRLAEIADSARQRGMSCQRSAPANP